MTQAPVPVTTWTNIFPAGVRPAKKLTGYADWRKMKNSPFPKTKYLICLVSC